MNKFIVAKELLKIAREIIAGGPQKVEIKGDIDEETKKKIEKLIKDFKERRAAWQEVEREEHTFEQQLASDYLDIRAQAKQAYDKFNQRVNVDEELAELKNARDLLMRIGEDMAKLGHTIDLSIAGLHLVVKKSTKLGNKEAAQMQRGLQLAYGCGDRLEELQKLAQKYIVSIRSSHIKLITQVRSYLTNECKDMIDYTNESMAEYNKSRVEEGLQPIKWDEIKWQDAMKVDPFAGNTLKKSSVKTAGFKDVFKKFLDGIGGVLGKIKGLAIKIKDMIASLITGVNKLDGDLKQVVKLLNV